MQKEEVGKQKKALFWFRNDLRLEDNVGLYHTLSKYDSVACVFVFDKEFLRNLKKKDLTMDFLYRSIAALKVELRSLGSDLIIRLGNPVDEIPELAKKYDVNSVVINRTYQLKDERQEDIIEKKLYKNDIILESYKDNVIFSPEDLLKDNGDGFDNYSSYREIWNKTIKNEDIKPIVVNKKEKFAKFKTNDLPLLEQFGFVSGGLSEKMNVSPDGAWEQFLKFKDKSKRYVKVKEIVQYAGVSYMSMYLRFGLISVRTMLSSIALLMKSVNQEEKENIKHWIDQLIRREFNLQYYFHNPRLLSEPYKKHYLNMKWENNMEYFNAWCNGETGYPIIDASMKSLQKTGYLHHRLRQITATFLTKVLCVDYKYGEAFFAASLIDYDPVSNNLGWQWAAGVDNNNLEYIQMYDPSENSMRFDPAAQFIKRNLPQLSKCPSKMLHNPWKYKKELEEYNVFLGENYPERLVDYDKRKFQTLKMYEQVNLL